MPKTLEGSTSNGDGPKLLKRSRSKARACTSCRKSRTRCDIDVPIEENANVSCHRCRNLGLQCSYTGMDINLLRSYAEVSRIIQDVSASSTPQSESPEASSASHASETSVQETLFSDTADSIFLRFDQMWVFVRDYPLHDWSTPLLALDTLSKQAYKLNASHTILYESISPDSSLDDILSSQLLQNLLTIFKTRYMPWLNINLLKDSSTDHILDLVCCTIASRDIDIKNNALKLSVRLRKLTTDSVVKIIFNPQRFLSLEVIQALLILSLWAPLNNEKNGMGNGTLLITTAIGMAMQLHLDTASAAIDAAMSAEREIDTTILDSARLWCALTNVESLLCLGSERTGTSSGTLFNIRLFTSSQNAPDSLESCRDTRLQLTASLFATITSSRSVRLTSPEGIIEWYDAISDHLTALERIRRLSEPLQVLCRHEKFHHQVFPILIEAGRICIAYQGLYDTHLASTGVATDPLWFLGVKPRGLAVIMTWGSTALRASDTLLTLLLQADASLLSATPDHVFALITFAVGVSVGFLFLMKSKVGRESPGYTFDLIDRTVEHLRRIASSPDHAAARCAYTVAGMAKAWKNRQNAEIKLPVMPLPSQDLEVSLLAVQMGLLQTGDEVQRQRNLSIPSDEYGTISAEGSPDGQNLFWIPDEPSVPWPNFEEELPGLQDNDVWQEIFGQQY